MRLGQLAKMPPSDGRRAERRVVNLAAWIRESGAALATAEVLNLSVTGFAADSDMELEIGTCVWLKLPGLEPQNCTVMWVDGTKAGFEFANPLHPATLDLVIATGRRPTVKRHFGKPGAVQGRTL